MSYGETKVYFDGSHYIAIPHTTRPTRRKAKPSSHRKTTERKQEFERLYRENAGKQKTEKMNELISGLNQYFKDEDSTIDFVKVNMARKKRNAIVRRMRLARKVNLQEFNYFCTFTYDDQKHSEESFRKTLSNCFKHFSYRKQWKYVGAWERSPEKKRLHFHGIFYIPDGTMVGKLEEHSDYSFNSHSRQTTTQNTYFNERFGRSDFDPIDNRAMLGKATAYLMKYIEKSGERLVYSKGLPTYFMSDIMDYDIVCKIGQEDKKLLLFDDFTCWDEGCHLGKVSPEIISQTRKSN